MANIELDGANKKIKVDSGDLTLDVPGDIILDADGGDVVVADGGTNILKVTNSSSDVVFQPQVDAKDIIFKQYDGTTVATVEDNGTFNIPANKLAIGGTAVTSTAAELNILDGVTSTAAELNIVDGDTSATSTTLADADRVVVNDNGTMVQVAMSDVKTYIGAGTNINLFKAYRNGQQTINHGTVTKVELNAESFDVDSKFDPSTNYRYTPASTGYYYLSATINFTPNDSGGDRLRRAYLHIYKNGSTLVRSNLKYLDGEAIIRDLTLTINTIDNSTSTSDYYEVYAEADNPNGSNNCAVQGGTAYTYFTGNKLIT